MTHRITIHVVIALALAACDPGDQLETHAPMPDPGVLAPRVEDEPVAPPDPRPPEVTSITLDPGPVILEVIDGLADEHGYTVMARFDDGSYRDVTDDSELAVDPRTLGRFEEDWFVPAGHEGCGVVTATYGAWVAESPVEVVIPGLVPDVDVYVAGSMTDWGVGAEGLLLRDAEDPGLYHVEMRIDAGTHVFKVADETWGVHNLGRGPDMGAVQADGVPLPMVQNGGTATLVIETTGTYRFTLDARGDQPAVEVTHVPDTEVLVTLEAITVEGGADEVGSGGDLELYGLVTASSAGAAATRLLDWSRDQQVRLDEHVSYPGNGVPLGWGHLFVAPVADATIDITVDLREVDVFDDEHWPLVIRDYPVGTGSATIEAGQYGARVRLDFTMQVI